MNIKIIPQALKDMRQWVLWRRDHGTKIPYQPNGYKASSANPATWSGFDEVNAKVDQFSGVGFVFTPNDPFVFIDLDHVLALGTTTFKPSCKWAEELVKALDTYCEISPSGDGLHLFATGNAPEGLKNKQKFEDGSAIEVYTSGRYSTVTGNIFGGKIEIKECDLNILSRYVNSNKIENTAQSNELFKPDEWVIEQMQNHHQWDYGVGQDGNSEIDAKFIMHLLFWCSGDADQAERIARMNPLYRPKWDRKNSGVTQLRYEINRLNTMRDKSAAMFAFQSPTLNEYENVNKDIIPRNRLLKASEITKTITATKWLIRNIIPEEGLLEIFGASGSYKSFLVLDMLFCIASGLDYHGCKVERGTVVYIAGEGEKGVRKRLRAFELHYGVEDYDLHVLPVPANLIEREEIMRLTTEIKEIAPEGIAIMIFDTLHRNSAGSDENSSKDFAVMLGHIDTLLKPISKVVGWVHHTGNEVKERGRGTSSRYGAMDTVILIEKEETQLRAVMSCKKQKDDEEFEKMLFNMEKVPLGIVQEGTGDEVAKELRSLVPVRTELGGLLRSKSNLKKEHFALLDCLRLIINDHGKALSDEIKKREHFTDGLCVSVSEWKAEAMKVIISNGDDDPKKQLDAKSKAFTRRKKDLIEAGQIGEFDNVVWIVSECRNYFPPIIHNNEVSEMAKALFCKVG